MYPAKVSEGYPRRRQTFDRTFRCDQMRRLVSTAASRIVAWSRKHAEYRILSGRYENCRNTRWTRLRGMTDAWKSIEWFYQLGFIRSSITAGLPFNYLSKYLSAKAILTTLITTLLSCPNVGDTQLMNRLMRILVTLDDSEADLLLSSAVHIQSTKSRYSQPRETHKGGLGPFR